MGRNVVFEKSKIFALEIVKLYRFLCDEKHEFVLSKQVLRSGTSIGANIAEAEYGISRNDFLAKMYIALKECAETKYWIDLLSDAGYLEENRYAVVARGCDELLRLLSSITKSAREKNGNRNS